MYENQAKRNIIEAERALARGGPKGHILEQRDQNGIELSSEVSWVRSLSVPVLLALLCAAAAAGRTNTMAE